MIGRLIGFSKALWGETAKRIPYITAILLALLVVSSYLDSQKTAQNTQATKDLTAKVLTLSSDNKTLIQQNKDLSAQNVDLSRKNATQLKCISNIFVDFINNNGVPSHADVENCQSVLNNSGTNNSSGGVTAGTKTAPSLSGGSASRNPGKSGSAPKKSAGSPQPAPQAQPNLLSRTICTLTLSLLGCQ